MRVLQSEHPRPLDVLAIGAGGYVAAGCAMHGISGQVDIWNVATGAIELAYAAEGYDVQSLAFTPSGSHLLLWSSWLTVLTVATGEVSPGPALQLSHPRVALSVDGRLLLAITQMNQSSAVELWTAARGNDFAPTWTARPHAYGECFAPAISPDATRVAVGVTSAYAHPHLWMEVRRATDGATRHAIPLDAADPPQQLTFTTDGSEVLARSLSRTVRVYDARTGEPCGELVHKGRPFVTGMAVHPGGRAIATCRNDGTVWLWDPATFRPLRSLDWKLGKLVSVAFSPDGSLAAAGTERGQVVVWDVDE